MLETFLEVKAIEPIFYIVIWAIVLNVIFIICLIIDVYEEFKGRNM